MEEDFLFIENLPIPCIVHHKNEIKQTNKAFQLLMDESVKISDLNFSDWLKSIMTQGEQASSLIKAIEQIQECSIEAGISYRGTAQLWKIMTLPIAQDHIQFTYLYDESVKILSKSYWDLHLRISKATMQLLKEINERKKAEKKADELSQQLIFAARRAGMSDIATSILHNVGNILNSVNTSISIIAQTIQSMDLTRLQQVIKIINEHTNTQQKSNDKIIPAFEYINLLLNDWEENKKKISGEVGSLQMNVETINKIITTQQSLSGNIGLIEKTSLQEIINDSLMINKTAIEHDKIEIIRNLKFEGTIDTDRVKLLQILTNLIKNSIDSLRESKNTNKKIIISLQEEEGQVLLQIIDNGIGILAENKNKIYNYGFTTKKKGHGFGLHASALAAKEMGGSLISDSEGENKGATFTLTLPLNYPQKELA
jgi:C4-dicarboxylate-specific signal transduction histidine kinase